MPAHSAAGAIGDPTSNSAYTGGELTTRPLTFAGSKLQLNVATGAGGTVRVEVLAPDGRAIDGFALADADEITGNYVRVPASWRQSADVGALAGQPVKLRFVMRDAKLYSFQFPRAVSAGHAVSRR